MMGLTSTHMNFMVFRYLLESGLNHAAFTLGYEAGLNKVEIDGNTVPTGTLVSLVQKGMQYMELNANVPENAAFEDMNAEFEDLTAEEVLTKDIDELRKIVNQRRARTVFLEGHTAEVYCCQWNPVSPLLASAAADSTVRIWNLKNGSLDSHTVLNLENGVIALNWNENGSVLATGSDKGVVCTWCPDGKLKSASSEHGSEVYSISWRGNHFVTGSKDMNAVVWDGNTGTVKQKFRCSDSVLDVDWRDDTSFATASKVIHVCELGKEEPIKHFAGHTDTVNAVRYDPAGRLLASCSEDRTVKIWSMDQNACLQDLKGHTKDVYTIRWSPSGPNSSNPNQRLILASVSVDGTVKLWDPERGVRLCSFPDHEKPVYSVNFSPDGEFLVTGGNDNCLRVWSVKGSCLVKQEVTPGSVFEACFNRDGSQIAAACGKTVAVMDFRM